jgi:arsenate reductase
MSEIGIDLSGHRSKSVDEFVEQEFDYIITVCDHAKELCPVFPGRTRHLHWSLPDPAAVSGSDEERKTAFRNVRDEIRNHLKVFAAEHGPCA